jgi:hypothetical protein
MLGLLAAITQKGRHARRCLKWNAAQRPTPGLQTLSQNVVPINQAGQASTKQVNFINMLCKQKGLSTQDINDIMRKLRADHNATFADLTSKEASALIKSLQA